MFFSLDGLSSRRVWDRGAACCTLCRLVRARRTKRHLDETSAFLAAVALLTWSAQAQTTVTLTVDMSNRVSPEVSTLLEASKAGTRRDPVDRQR